MYIFAYRGATDRNTFTQGCFVKRCDGSRENSGNRVIALVIY